MCKSSFSALTFLFTHMRESFLRWLGDGRPIFSNLKLFKTWLNKYSFCVLVAMHGADKNSKQKCNMIFAIFLSYEFKALGLFHSGRVQKVFAFSFNWKTGQWICKNSLYDVRELIFSTFNAIYLDVKLNLKSSMHHFHFEWHINFWLARF